MKRKTTKAQLISEEAQLIADYQNGARACIQCLSKLKKEGIGWMGSGLSSQFAALNTDAKVNFLTTLELFLAGAVGNLDISACYENGKTAHKAARAAFIDQAMKEQAA